MGRLIVVSNRVPVPKPGTPPAGGLAVALSGAMQSRGGVWFGWSGDTAAADAPEPAAPRTLKSGSVTYALVDLKERDLDDYYAGFSNRMLWPLFHYRMDLTEFTRVTLGGYYRVNGLFSRLIAPMAEPDDVIWVHDYHLIPLAAELRAAGLRNRMGFFLHIPFPPPDILTVLPNHADIVRGLAAYDVVGFQTPLDVENFETYLRREKVGRRMSDGRYVVHGRAIRVEALPVGIETQTFAETAKASERNALVRRMEESMIGRRLIIGVDRLDYSKGIAERIQAFETFLTLDDHWRGKCTYLQITPKSRSEVAEYAAMEREVAELAGRVNGKHADLDWTPIRYVNRTIGRNALAGLYRMAAVGLVTPLRDGMNLVAKEYVAAQDPEDPGVLLLSRFAGAAFELADGAMLTNPYDIDGTAGALARALVMPLDERLDRWRRMYERIRVHDVAWWCRSFLEALENDAPKAAAAKLSPIKAAS
ncbi:alpha,alpha-trehalose-phosphate synthase (UDP-forming) [Hansschlegelia zhihuaiae]|uniref:Trehalose-6-phosphate synthase n=1 Tax=Hansschlegelia zhihuaiae TaxID=405005 RepID=A0A4Q0MLF0_9HYPH|nr:alpha,alpha-trehalose-phosphate synthase (UDP-forming) [Hansschlegelia zhihuaiae]RXF74353.1 alpha,alpha-trehalose-phosphate synthase (UDP-forming) [Hansschlegelia zhihuaiae]